MSRLVFLILLIGYLPGALVFRLPVADRASRAALPAEERAFWAVMLSVLTSGLAAFTLALFDAYRFERLVWICGGLCGLVLVAANLKLRYGGSARRPAWTAVVPLAVAGLAWYVAALVPPAEYVMGGKDPGVYMNEGIQIAQRGSLIIRDTTVHTLPAAYRDLAFPRHRSPDYYSTRFMGFFLLDPAAATVVGQFPHLYPVSIAVAYGLYGLSGARWVLVWWSVLGVVALYMLGARLFGRAAAAAGASLLAIHVVRIWYARYPNAETMLQPLLLAAALAYVRAQTDGQACFRPVTALLLVCAVLTHLTGVFAVAAIAAAAVAGRCAGHRLAASMTVPLAVGTALALAYYVTHLPAYFRVPTEFFRLLSPLGLAALALAAVAGGAFWWLAARPAAAATLRRIVPVLLIGALWAAAGYAYFLRTAAGALAPQDADSLRTFTSFYLTPLGLALALAGLAVTARRTTFWTAAPLLALFAMFALVFFYKLRVVPEHFWAARRFLAVVLPGALLLAGAAAFGELRSGASDRWRRLTTGPIRWARYAAGAVLIGLLAWQFVRATRPVLHHVEYAGLIPRLEALAGRFTERDLVLVEARMASDTHVLALPLAYIYARNVLVLGAPDPDKAAFRSMLAWANEQYDRVFFVGGGGTELLSRLTPAIAVAGERFQIPEYESEWNTYPTRVRFKEFDFGVYELPSGARDPAPIDLDVGVADDLYVRRFNAKERHANGTTFRWSRDVSYVSLAGIPAGCGSVTIWMHGGGRPAAAPAAQVTVFLNEQRLGSVVAADAMQAYTFAIPLELGAALAADEDAARLRLETPLWNPRALAGVDDDRYLGVMVDRVQACGPREAGS